MREKLETESIINEANSVYGLKSCIETIRNYNTYIKLKSKINFGNFNVLIKNKSKYNSAEKLVDILYKLLMANNVINTGYKYIEKYQFSKFKEKNDGDIEESLLILDSEKLYLSKRELKIYYKEFVFKYPDKIFILIEEDDSFRNESLDIEDVIWYMEIEQIFKENKKDYIIKTLKEQKIKLDEKNSLLENLSNESYREVKNEVLNLIIKCKANNITKINDNILQNKLNCKYLPKVKINDKKKEISGIQQLENLIGLEEIKAQIKQIINYIRVNRKRGKLPMLHMCFLGNPGCGKTEIARIVGKIFAEEKILSDKNIFIEVQRGDLIGEFIGHTAVKTKDVIEEALGGVLFIDEAYSLKPSSEKDFGHECIATLIKEMEDKRDKLCVIFAGYTNEMNDLFEVNPRFRK